jgi:hypothetical protein
MPRARFLFIYSLTNQERNLQRMLITQISLDPGSVNLDRFAKMLCQISLDSGILWPLEKSRIF